MKQLFCPKKVSIFLILSALVIYPTAIVFADFHGGRDSPTGSDAPLPGETSRDTGTTAGEAGVTGTRLEKGTNLGIINPVPGHGSAQGSNGIGIVGGTGAEKIESIRQGTQNGWVFSGQHDAKTGKDIMLPCSSSCKGSNEGVLPGGGVADPTSLPSVDSTVSEGIFGQAVEEDLGIFYPRLPNGSLDMSKTPVFAWQPTVPSDVLAGGLGKLCISNVCNPDLSFFSEKDKGSKYVLEGTGVGGWSPFPTGESGPRFCMGVRGCVVEWTLPEAVAGIQASPPTLAETLPPALLEAPTASSNPIDLTVIGSNARIENMAHNTKSGGINPTDF